jgi:hydrophobic/amphiphilic exporter-1 (mainly G- bacteria), HAE1 family
MWHLTKLAVRSRILTIALAIIIGVVSIWALMGLKMELIPNIEFPYATIVTIYPEATPDLVVDQVTRPIEQMVFDEWHNKGLKHVNSTSSKGMSLIFAEFDFGTDMTRVTKNLEEGISGISFPQEVVSFPQLTGSSSKNPQIIPINMNMIPLVSLSVSGDIPPYELKQIADSEIVPQLTGIEGVLRVDTEGGEKDQIVIAPDPEKMNQYGISLSEIAGLLSAQYTSLDEVSNTPLLSGSSTGEVTYIKLGDVASITQGPPPLSTITRTDGHASVGISVMKTEKGNTVEVANAVAAKVNEIKSKLGNDVHLITVLDQSDFIESSISQLWEKAVIGGVLAIIVVFVFLWAVRASLITAISIPLSMLIGFLCMRITGITINLLTLSAMSIAVGRLIDDSIVMVEVIFRRRRQGENFLDAAVGGAKEVATAVTTATLATVAIFIPLMFVGGIVGELFVPFALTVTFAMLASLLVALTVVPALSRFLISGKSATVKSGDNWYHRIYLRLLKWSLLHRAIVIIVAVVLFVGSLGLFPVIGTSFMSGMSEKIIYVDISLPPKTGVDTTSEVASQVEGILKENKSVKTYYTSVGTSTSMAGILSAASGGGTNTATITVYVNPDTDMQKETDVLDKACQQLSGATIAVTNSEAGGHMGISTSGVSISVQGSNQEEVAGVTAQLVEKLKGIEGLSDLKSDITTVDPKLNIAIDQSKILASGLPAEQISLLQQEFYLLMMGSTIPDKVANIDSENYPIFIKSLAEDFKSVEQAQQFRIGFPQSVALGDIANVTILDLPSHISHTDTALSATISGTILSKDVGAVNRAVQKEIDALPSHPGVDIITAGIAEQMGDTFSRMFIAIIIAIVIVLAIVILMMRSIRNPLIIMVSLPLASIGALLALAISGYTLGISAMMGMLMLVGIVLTNAIVLITLVEQLQKTGLNTTDAVIQGGKTRLRPILMTALTTIFAMVPLAVGVGSGTIITAELAIVVIGGMFSSTLLTLLVIPVVYSLVHRQPKTKLAK